MKKFLRFGAIALFLAFASCSDDDASNIAQDNNNAPGTMTATINGQSWTATEINTVRLMRVPSMGAQRFDISGRDSQQVLDVAFESALTTGGMPVQSYFMTEDGGNAIFTNRYAINGNTYMEHFADTGTITVTSVDHANKKISGTFSFNAHKVGVLQDVIVTPENVTVTNGVFTNLTYTVLE